MSADLKLAIFDLGQVFFRTHLERCCLEWENLGGLLPGALARVNWGDEIYEDYERGRISGRSYCEHFCEINAIDLDYDQWKEGWNALFGEIIQPTLETIESMRDAGLTVVALSNTNATHVEAWKVKYQSPIRKFHETYLSNEIGMRKPDARVFQFVLDAHECDASQAIFFDDKPENVSAARGLGMESVLFDDDSAAAFWWKRNRNCQRPNVKRKAKG